MTTQTYQNSNFAFAFKLLPPEKAQALSAVYSFSRIVDDCVDCNISVEAKQQALSFWREQLTQPQNNETTHVIVRQLSDVMQRYQIPVETFLGLIAGCEMDIHNKTYETFADLERYCYHVAGLVGLACMKIFEYDSPTANDTAINLGLALQLTNMIRDVRADMTLGRIYLAQKDMQHYNYSAEDLKNHTHNDAFVRLMQYYAARAETSFQKAFEEFAVDKENKLLAAKAMASIYRALLKKIQRKNFPVFKKRVSLCVCEKALAVGPLFLKKTLHTQ